MAGGLKRRRCNLSCKASVFHHRVKFTFSSNHSSLTMASSLASMAARRTPNLTRLASPFGSSSQSASLLHRRGLASAADHHGPAKVNCWQDPMSPSKWKEEHFVIVSLTGWGLFLTAGYKFFTGGNKNKEGTLVEAAQ